jgi:hypothetical protein
MSGGNAGTTLSLLQPTTRAWAAHSASLIVSKPMTSIALRLSHARLSRLFRAASRADWDRAKKFPHIAASKT